MKDYKKHGEMKGDVGAMINLIVGVGVAVLVLVFVGSLGGQTYNLVESDLDVIGRTTVTGDTFVGANQTAVALDNGNLYTGTLSITNGTNLVHVSAGNYTADLTAGTITLKNFSAFNGNTLTAGYQYQDFRVQDDVKRGVISGFDALKQTGDYLPVIVMAFVIAMVLGLVLSMSMGKTGGGNSAL